MQLVIWQHARNAQECIELIRHLVTPAAQSKYCPILGLMPVRVEALAEPFYSADPHYKVLVEALHQGRVPTSFPLWGMVEDKLSASFVQIWLDIFNRPYDSLDTILSKHLDALANRFDITRQLNLSTLVFLLKLQPADRSRIVGLFLLNRRID